MNPTSVRTLTPEASASTNSATFAQCEQYQRGFWCEGGDLNPTSVRTLTPEEARLPIPTFAYHQFLKELLPRRRILVVFSFSSIVNYRRRCCWKNVHGNCPSACRFAQACGADARCDAGASYLAYEGLTCRFCRSDKAFTPHPTRYSAR